MLDLNTLQKLAAEYELNKREEREYDRANKDLDEYPTVEQLKRISNNFIGLCTNFLCTIYPKEAHPIFDDIHSNYLADCIQYGEVDLEDDPEDGIGLSEDEYESELDTCEFDFDFEPSLHLEEDEDYEYSKTNPWKKLGIKLEK